MIYIMGTALSVDQLPLHDELEYRIENRETKLRGILMMQLPRVEVVSCYVNSSIELPRIADSSKIIRFSSDDELLAILSGKPAEESKPSVPEPEVQEPIAPEAISDEEVLAANEQLKDERTPEYVKPVASESDNSSDIEELDSKGSIPDAMLSDESIFDVDRWKARLAAVEAALHQSRECQKVAVDEKNELYDYAVEQIEQTVQEYELKLKEAIDACETMKAELAKPRVEAGPLTPFEAYADKCRAIIKVGLTLEQAPSNVITVAAGSPDTTATLYQSLSLLALSGFSGAIIDFTGDPAFGITLSNVARKVKMMQSGGRATKQELEQCGIDPSKDLVDVIRGRADLQSVTNTQFGKSKVAVAGFYHDLALLTFDWASFIQTAGSVEYANNQPVIIILPPMTSFVSRYLVSYLSTAVCGCVATICAPSALYSTNQNLCAVPSARVKLLVFNYFKHQTTDSLLQGELGDKFAIRVFKAIDFFALATPTQKDFDVAIGSNAKIWADAFSGAGK